MLMVVARIKPLNVAVQCMTILGMFLAKVVVCLYILTVFVCILAYLSFCLFWRINLFIM